DASFSLAELLELMGLGQAATTLLEDAHRSATASGDEIRRAEAGWRLARNLAFGVQDSAARGRVAALAAECSEIAGRLDVREADAGAALARSIAASADGEWGVAAEQSRIAEAVYREIGDLPGEIFAKRERLRALAGAAVGEGRIDLARFDELSEALQRFAIENAPGLQALVKFELAQVAGHFDPDLAMDLATDAARAAQRQGHPVLVTRAGELRDALSVP
ncbi:MAG TPA: hypothetical protein VF263_17525, partial [Longimicrobiaceae bacterium]